VEFRFVKKLTLALALAGGLPGLVPASDASAQPEGRPAARGRAPQPSPATERGPSAVEILNKSLNPGGSSDPDVPLPHPDLANVGPSGPSRGGGAQVYGRQEEGGGVLGFRMPIPVDRGSSTSAAKSGGASTGANTLQNR
jgi:hypothetical protein